MSYDHVRPTKRALDDLGLKWPPLSTPLHLVDHDLLRHAQRLPEEVAAGGAEKVACLPDRVWLKIKTGVYRGAGLQIGDADALATGLTPFGPSARWWVGAAGVRQSDSDRHDFYALLAAAAKREGRGSGSATSEHLLPTPEDRRRLELETTTLAVEAVKAAVRQLLVASLHDGHPYSLEIVDCRLTALVRAPHGEAYLAVIAEGRWDHKWLAVILDSIPGVQRDDWQAEPDGVEGIDPGAGQIIWSTFISPQAQAELLEGAEPPNAYLGGR